MSFFERIKNNKYLALALLFAFLSIVAILLFFGFQKYDDSPGYIYLIYWLQGKEAGPDIAFNWMIMGPMEPLVAIPFQFLGDGAGIIVQNILFYFFSVYLIFRIIQLVFNNKEQALWGAILFAAALPVLQFGLSYMTDMGAWFFYIISVFLTLLYLKNRDEKLILANGLLSSFGMLVKTDGGLGIVFFSIMILLSGEFKIRDKFFKMLKFGIPFLLPILAYQTCLFIFFHITSFSEYMGGRQWFFTQGVEDLKVFPGTVYSHFSNSAVIIYAYVGEFLKSFGVIGLLFALIGFWREFLQKSKERIKIYLSLLPVSLAFVVFQPSNSRFSFLSTPLMILWATQGLFYLKSIFSEKIGKLIVPLLLASYVVFNYYFQIVGSYRLIFLKLISFIK